MVQDQPRQKRETLSEKQSERNRTGSMAEVAEHLPSKYKALNSISNATKIK
jgi:hypothetical protein